jgi:hypothetical protein
MLSADGPSTRRKRGVRWLRVERWRQHDRYLPVLGGWVREVGPSSARPSQSLYGRGINLHAALISSGKNGVGANGLKGVE